MVREHNRLSTDVVVATAARLVDRDGVDAVTLTRVAAELGVSQPALYKHVRDAPDLLRRLALLARRQLLAALGDAAVGRAGDDALAAVADAWRGFVRDHPGLYEATDRHPLAGFPELEGAAADVVALVARVVASFGLADEDVEHAAWSVRSALHGFVSLEATEGHPSSMDLDESFHRMVDLLGSGIAAQAGKRRRARPPR